MFEDKLAQIGDDPLAKLDQEIEPKARGHSQHRRHAAGHQEHPHQGFDRAHGEAPIDHPLQPLGDA